MTIPANNWCSSCQEACHDHATICTVCGTTLGEPPQRESSSSRNNTAPSYTAVRVIPDVLSQDLRLATHEIQLAAQEIQGILDNLRMYYPASVSIEHLHANSPLLRSGLQGAVFSSVSGGRPTSKEFLDNLPRIILDDKSSLFRQSTLQVAVVDDSENATTLSFDAVPGEFGVTDAFHIDKSSIIIASPLTGKGGLSTETLTAIRESSTKPIVYMERGDGITFVSKAKLAQDAGAAAVAIGNNLSEPWPYVMKDSKGEAESERLGPILIPVTMVKRSDGKQILDYCRKQQHSNCHAVGTLDIRSLSKDCVICCETFSTSNTVLRLPSCGHIFHELCALAWLTKHNTCPTCRMELPTDDLEYENERRRLQRTHAGSIGPNNNDDQQWNGFYS